MKTFTVVVEDNTVIIDGIYLKLDLSLVDIDKNIRAIQWNADKKKGHVEYTDGTHNRELDNIKEFSKIVDLFLKTQKKIESDRKQAEELEKVKVANTPYYLKRAGEYPTIPEQLDALWKMIEPPIDSEAKKIKDSIISVKAKYPKEDLATIHQLWKEDAEQYLKSKN